MLECDLRFAARYNTILLQILNIQLCTIVRIYTFSIPSKHVSI